jgi:hypothetical protein
MFSEEAQVWMANGRGKNINQIQAGEWVLNKILKPVRVQRVITFQSAPAVNIEFDNGKGAFYASPDTKVFIAWLDDDGGHSQYSTISEAHTMGAHVKSSLKSFSPESNVDFANYDDQSETKTLYALETVDQTHSYMVMGVITVS